MNGPNESVREADAGSCYSPAATWRLPNDPLREESGERKPVIRSAGQERRVKRKRDLPNHLQLKLELLVLELQLIALVSEIGILQLELFDEIQLIFDKASLVVLLVVLRVMALPHVRVWLAANLVAFTGGHCKWLVFCCVRWRSVECFVEWSCSGALSFVLLIAHLLLLLLLL